MAEPVNQEEIDRLVKKFISLMDKNGGNEEKAMKILMEEENISAGELVRLLKF